MRPGLTRHIAIVPVDCSASRGDAPAIPALPAIPYTCAADDGARAHVEYDDNGHYLAGPLLAQPDALVKMIGDAQVSEPPDAKRAAAAKQIAADRTAYRQGLPVPSHSSISALAASTRARRRKGLGRGGYRGLLDAIRGTA